MCLKTDEDKEWNKMMLQEQKKKLKPFPAAVALALCLFAASYVLLQCFLW